MPTGSLNLMSVMRLPPIGSSALRILIGIVTRNSSTASPCRSWYRRRPAVTPARKTWVCGARLVGGPEHVIQRELQDVVVPGEVAFRHDRRQCVRHGLEEPGDGLAGGQRLGDCLTGVSQGVRHIAGSAGDATFRELEKS